MRPTLLRDRRPRRSDFRARRARSFALRSRAASGGTKNLHDNRGYKERPRNRQGHHRGAQRRHKRPRPRRRRGHPRDRGRRQRCPDIPETIETADVDATNKAADIHTGKKNAEESDGEKENDSVAVVVDGKKNGGKKSKKKKACAVVAFAKKIDAPAPVSNTSNANGGAKKHRKRLVEETAVGENKHMVTRAKTIWEDVEEEEEPLRCVARHSMIGAGGCGDGVSANVTPGPRCRK